MKYTDIYLPDERELLSSCTLCPRECGVDRFEAGTGYCGADAGLNIASICIHRGEEPPISGINGICNIFFAGCNMRCLYCQNYEISRPECTLMCPEMEFDTYIDIIEGILSKGIKAVGFVSPSHVVPQVKAIIRGLNSRGFKPITVYNTNSYDKVDTIRSLNGLIDVYLPDYKYVTSEVAYKYSDAYNYPEVALMALKEMYFQKGSVLRISEDGFAESGILIRHLVLPGHAAESIKVLRSIVNELSPGVSISLMSQYQPTHEVKNHQIIGRNLSRKEYQEVTTEMEKLGFRNGWLQDMESNINYLPDFSKEHPFE